MELISRKEAIALGLKRYFTGKPCSKGHIDYRNTCDHACCACGREKSKAFRADNPEYVKKMNLKQSEKRRSSPELKAKAVKQAKKWADENREKYLAYLKERYKANRDEYLEKMRERYYERRKDPEWVKRERERCQEKHKKNPEVKKSASRTRRARMLQAEGRHNASDIKRILQSQEFRCVYCKRDISSGYDVDHINPISRGGSNWPDNLQCLCPSCNGKKWALNHEEYLEKINKFGQ